MSWNFVGTGITWIWIIAGNELIGIAGNTLPKCTNAEVGSFRRAESSSKQGFTSLLANRRRNNRNGRETIIKILITAIWAFDLHWTKRAQESNRSAQKLRAVHFFELDHRSSSIFLPTLHANWGKNDRNGQNHLSDVHPDCCYLGHYQTTKHGQASNLCAREPRGGISVY